MRGYFRGMTNKTAPLSPPTHSSPRYLGRRRRTRPAVVRTRALAVCALGVALIVSGWVYTVAEPHPWTITIPVEAPGATR